MKCENAVEQQVRDLINQERAKVGAKPLAYSPILYDVAKKYAETMLKGNFFSHTGQDGSTMGSRIKAGGYTGWSSLAENIARGQSSAQSVVTSWMNSAGHRANILNPRLNEMSVAHSSTGWYWVQNFGERRGAQPPVNPPALPPKTRAPTRAPAPAPAPAPGPGPRPTPPKPTTTPKPATPKPSNPNRPTNGMAIFYYQGTNFETFKAQTYGPVNINNPTGSQFLVGTTTVPGMGFSAKFHGKFKASATGTFHFETVSDDGIRVSIGGLKAIDNWVPHSPTINRSPPIHLTAGAYYQLKVEYFNYGGPGTLQLFYQAPGMNDSVIVPESVLFPDHKATPQSK